MTSSTLLNAGLQTVAKGILQYGVTGFCPTLVTQDPQTYRHVFANFARSKGGKDGAANLGAHVEGPFINPEKKGAHPLNVLECSFWLSCFCYICLRVFLLLIILFPALFWISFFSSSLAASLGASFNLVLMLCSLIKCDHTADPSDRRRRTEGGRGLLYHTRAHCHRDFGAGDAGRFAGDPRAGETKHCSLCGPHHGRPGACRRGLRARGQHDYSLIQRHGFLSSPRSGACWSFSQ